MVITLRGFRNVSCPVFFLVISLTSRLSSPEYFGLRTCRLVWPQHKVAVRQGVCHICFRFRSLGDGVGDVSLWWPAVPYFLGAEEEEGEVEAAALTRLNLGEKFLHGEALRHMAGAISAGFQSSSGSVPSRSLRLEGP